MKDTEEYGCAFRGLSTSAKHATLTTMVLNCCPKYTTTITKLKAEFMARYIRFLSILGGDGATQYLQDINLVMTRIFEQLEQYSFLAYYTYTMKVTVSGMYQLLHQSKL